MRNDLASLVLPAVGALRAQNTSPPLLFFIFAAGRSIYFKIPRRRRAVRSRRSILMQRWSRGFVGGAGVVALVLLAVAVQRSPQHQAAVLGSKGSDGAPLQALSEADLYMRKGAAQDIVKAQDTQKAAASAFVQAVREETRASRAMADRAQFNPGSMEDAQESAHELAANEAKIRELGEQARAAGRAQVAASSTYVTAGQARYQAVERLQAELAGEAQAAYDIKSAVAGTAADRFDPATEGAEAYSPDRPKRNSYHVARLRGVDTDGSQSLCGRAEVKHANEWGSICYRGFTATSAEMFCKTMGLTGGTARYYDDMGRPTWDDSVITRADASVQPDSNVIWMTHVKCSGSETNILACPFGEAEEEQDWKNHDIANSGCGAASSVALCCDVSQFCPPRSQWRPDTQDFVHLGQTHGDMMQPTQSTPEMISNCKCDAGFFMEVSSVFSGKCTTCPLNSCSPVGSTSISDCTCLEGFYKNAQGECSACPANSCSARGITDISGCKCFAGYYMSGKQCVMCPEATTSKAGSTSEGECSMLCGLPDSSQVLEQSEVVANAAEEVAESTAAKRAAADTFVTACKKESDALDLLKTEAKYTPPLTLSPDAVDSYSNDVRHFEKDRGIMDKYAPIVAESGRIQVEETAKYLAAGDKLKSAMVTLQESFEAQLKKHRHIKEALTRCQPTVACVPSPCEEVEPSNPCEPWPSCYPHPCQPWPSCSVTLNSGEFSDVEQADPVTASRASPVYQASKAQEEAKSEKGKDAAKEAVSKALEAYDEAAGFNVDKTPDYFLTDDSSQDRMASKAYSTKRADLEAQALKRIQGEGKADTAGAEARALQVKAVLHLSAKGATGRSGDLQESGRGNGALSDSTASMEAADGDQDKLYKLFTSAHSDQVRSEGKGLDP